MILATYNSKIYYGEEELKRERPEIHKELGNARFNLEDFEQFRVFSTLIDYAEYELEAGWYSHILPTDSSAFRGAPNPLAYIDMLDFGEALTNTWDATCHFLTRDKRVIKLYQTF